MIMARYFKESEFTCSCGCGRSEMDQAFVAKLDELRHRYGKPIKISSGFRCENHPSERDKTTVGAHRQGRAVDIPCNGQEADKLIELSYQVGMTGRGVSQEKGKPRFLHLDTAPNAEGQPRPTLWSY